MTEKVLKNGVYVLEHRVGVSDFVRGFSTRYGPNSYFSGTWEELTALVENHFHDNEPGLGSMNGDVLLVNVPPKNFFTAVTAITNENAHQIETITTQRAEGEKPFTTRVLHGVKPAAVTAKIVIYRADVLAQDNDRSTDCEWEIVSINAGPGYPVPMSPTTMARNENHEPGGTKRVYTPTEWAESHAFWKTHAKVFEADPNPTATS